MINLCLMLTIRCVTMALFKQIDMCSYDQYQINGLAVRQRPKVCPYFSNRNNVQILVVGWVGYRLQGGCVILRKIEHCSDFKNMYIFLDAP